jgi:homopolymeric O-antigen transport system permease protein
VKEELQELYRFRELLYMIAYRDVRVRYKQSVMGFLWAVLMPILIVSAGVVVRYGYAVASGKPLQTGDVASVAVKSLPWAFLVSSIRFSCSSLINNHNLVTKVYFPKDIFPVAAVLASLFDFFVAAGALVIFLLFIQVGWSAQLAWVPLLLLMMVVLTVGIAMVVSAASLFFRDVKYVVEIVLTFGIFFTPVFYDVRMLGDKGHWLLLNPLAPILEGLGACVVRHQQPDLAWLAYSFIFGSAAALGGYVFFKHLEPAFAESI